MRQSAEHPRCRGNTPGSDVLRPGPERVGRQLGGTVQCIQPAAHILQRLGQLGVSRANVIQTGAGTQQPRPQYVPSLLEEDHGTVRPSRIESGSAYGRLNEAALKTVSALEAYEPFPDAIREDRIRVAIPIEYSLI